MTERTTYIGFGAAFPKLRKRRRLELWVEARRGLQSQVKFTRAEVS